MDSEIDLLVDAVLASSKYKNICREFIARIGAQELSKRRNGKEALKATKNKLHQVGGAYLETRVAYDNWLNELSVVAQGGKKDDLFHLCRQIMACHASTRERLPILDRFYAEIFTCLPPIRTVLDVGCGLNPLAIPWMPLIENAEYYACDIYQDMLDFLHAWMTLTNVRGSTEACDVVQHCPLHKVDVAFILKTIPCLEQIDRSVGPLLLRTINADHLVVSFPLHSLGGRSKGMLEHYEARFRELVSHEQWEIKRLEFSTELVFVVKKFPDQGN